VSGLPAEIGQEPAPQPVGNDPRPVIGGVGTEMMVHGARCVACGYTLAYSRPRCPVCGGRLESALYGPGGSVWACTTVRIAISHIQPPYGLAYVDLDSGPRVLAHFDPAGSGSVRVGSSVRLAGLTPDGNPLIEAVG